MRLPWRRADWLQYGTMFVRPEAIDYVRETGEEPCVMEVGTRGGVIIYLGAETAQYWRRWLDSNGKKELIARWTDIPNHPNHKKLKIFLSDNPANKVLK